MVLIGSFLTVEESVQKKWKKPKSSMHKESFLRTRLERAELLKMKDGNCKLERER